MGKAQRKQSLLKGYDAEKSCFSTIATSLTGAETRPITALDDVLAALRFAAGLLIKDKIIDDEEDEKVIATFSFCMGLFLEFSWTGKVSVNGKEHHQYSHLRTELQQNLIDGLQSLHTPEFAADEAAAGAKGKRDSSKSVTPLQLAEMLCTTFGDKPVTQVVWDDPDELPIRNILTMMTEKREECDALGAFVQRGLGLPVLLHRPVKDSLMDLFDMKRTMSLMDILSLTYDKTCSSMPSSWVGFGFDCVAAYADRGHFVEGSEKAGQL